MSIRRIDVIGAGAWGTALAALAAENGHEVRLWSHETEVAATINARHENIVYLPDVALPETLAATSDIAQMGDADAVLLVTPAQHLGGVSRQLSGRIAAGVPVAVCSKGIEQETGRLMTEVLAETLPDTPHAVLSGPTLAGEVARGMPAAVTIAADEQAVAEALVEIMGCARFRPYASTDTTGAQVGGALKNVIAVACGIVGGLGLGQNARAALVTRGLAEMTRLAVAKGARPETMMGLSGLGDLTLTCTSEDSRNYALGRAIGEGERPGDVLESRRTVAEGAYTARAVVTLAAGLGVEMPIADAVERIIHQNADLHQVIEELLSRPFKREGFGG